MINISKCNYKYYMLNDTELILICIKFHKLLKFNP